MRIHGGSKSHSGFTLAEVMTGAAITMMLAVIGVPNIVTTIANVRLRASMTSLSGVLANSRMQAVKTNKTMTTRLSAEPHGLIAYVKAAADASPRKNSDPQVQLQAPVSRMTAPVGPGAPSELGLYALGFTPSTGDPSFNSRGLPCLYSAGNCVTRGFRYYFKDSRSVGNSGWAALSISPAGRIKKWYWNGEVWVD